MAYPFPAMREVDANWKQYADVKMAYVTDADYARLKAEVERLTERNHHLEQIDSYLQSANLNAEEQRSLELEAQVERLTKAGDNLEQVLTEISYSYRAGNASHEWRAAKGGKQ